MNVKKRIKELKRMNVKMMRVVEKAMNEVVRESVMKCASWYGFDGKEALSKLEERGEEVEKKKNVEKEKEVVMPFVSELVKEGGCAGLCYNRGLFTQCPKAKKETELYCKTCEKEASSSERGKPLLGTVTDRLESDMMEFRDPKGRSPVAYSRIMSQLGLSRERVEAEACRLGVTIPEEHFATEKKRGRPKVEKKRSEKAETVEDLLSRMVTDEDEARSEAETVVMSDNEGSEEASSAEAEVTQSEEVAAKSALKAEKEATEAAQAALKGEKEAKAAAQAALKGEKEAKAAAQKAEKEAKAAAQKAEKEAKAAAQKAEKEAKAAAQKAEKEAKLAAEKGAKPKAKKGENEEAKTKTKKGENEAKSNAKETSGVTTSVSPVEAPSETTCKPKKVTVTRITIEGVEYLKTTENLLYNPQTKEEMGIYDPESKTIKPLPEESDDELDEDDYESDGN
jgi:hypothetical protein